MPNWNAYRHMKYRDIGFVKEDFLHVLPNSVKYRLTFHKVV